MARSLTMEIGAASEPARSSSASSRASLDAEARDLEAVAEHAADGGDVDDHLFLDVARRRACRRPHGLAALLDEHHAHALAEVGARGLEHFVAARAVELDVDLRAVLAVAAWRR